MQQSPKDIIVAVLTIIGYEDDKDAYADEFIKNCEKQAIADAIKALPERKQEELKQRLFWTHVQEKAKAIIVAYVTPEQYREAIQKAAQTAFQRLIEEIIPTLSNEQADKLQSYLQSLASLNTPAHP